MPLEVPVNCRHVELNAMTFTLRMAIKRVFAKKPTCTIIFSQLAQNFSANLHKFMCYNGQMKIQNYRPRIIDSLLKDKLKSAGAVQLKGPKWCGKTSTAAKIAKSAVFMQDPDSSANLIALANSKPSVLLEGQTPRLIDEWQMAPQIWDAVRYAVDQQNKRGLFILTGSSTPKNKYEPKHSGVGRIARLNMKTMSLFETQESTGEVSLQELFDKNSKVAALANFDIQQIAHAICRGGWPASVVERNPKIALSMAKDYVEELIDCDIEEMDDKTRNKTWMRRLLQSYARNISTESSLSTIANDMHGLELSRGTISDYIDALTRACVIDDIPAWAPRMRSKTAIRTTSTHHFCDPSIAAAMLGATPEKLIFDFETFGLLFESLCVHDLRVYVDKLGGEVYHYRDKSGLECDAVIELNDGRWALIEVKLGSTQIETAANNLKKLSSKIDKKNQGEPAFLMVLTGTQAAYTREDGVQVVPLSVLKD